MTEETTSFSDQGGTLSKVCAIQVFSHVWDLSGLFSVVHTEPVTSQTIEVIWYA